MFKYSNNIVGAANNIYAGPRCLSDAAQKSINVCKGVHGANFQGNKLIKVAL